jgi:hypothetical protein
MIGYTRKIFRQEIKVALFCSFMCCVKMCWGQVSSSVGVIDQSWSRAATVESN